ncbi:MAG: DNA-binding protein [Bacteroidaceae bacterium]|nr:DNA-binding protein [Bacteroidaceae bacterium]
MKKIIIVIERSADLFDAYSDNCDGIYGAGNSIEECKKDIELSIAQIKEKLPMERWPEEIRGEYELEYKLDAQSFLEYFSQYLSLAGMERITGVNQKQLSNYLNRRAKPRKQQIERISKGLRRFASELLSITL